MSPLLIQYSLLNKVATFRPPPVMALQQDISHVFDDVYGNLCIGKQLQRPKRMKNDRSKSKKFSKEPWRMSRECTFQAPPA
eukprot:scaffold32363_cov41-Attheya_sp.AAC.1